MKYDICMWAKNGETCLPTVLKRINNVLPQENINKKIFVDDSSTDETVNIAQDFGWTIYPNTKGWIDGGTQEALKHVTTDIFISVEQDVFLAQNFCDLLNHFENKKVAVAGGIYLPTTKYGRMYFVHHIEDLRKKGSGFVGIGSNFYRTKVIKETGFVTDKLLMTEFVENVKNAGYDWVTDYNVISEHIRKSFWEDLSHLERNMVKTSCQTLIDKKGLLKSVASVGKSMVYFKSGNPVIPVLEASVRLKLLEAYIKRKAYLKNELVKSNT